ncbi:hypothetical protein KFL_000260490 [Klebsormidium nitens]|uniref:Uncharacterized protein n=1 Tax=Klebsormidium nitens TaxID=105231 RepID=A0A1Y1HNC8_KLENI|nr:hypothetical protein KFL_000260490 [Klebsormidium nitens]|eukprot:GAQ79232.1 hypothetical protein KFL_000260490 [Klebsormidium nitens]
MGVGGTSPVKMAPRVKSRAVWTRVALSLVVLSLGVADARLIFPPDFPSPQGTVRLPTALANPIAVDFTKLPQYPRAGVTFFTSRVAAILQGSVSVQVPPPGMNGQPLQKTSVQYTITVGWDVLQVTIVAADQPLYLNQQKIPPGQKSSPVYLVGQVTILSVLATTAQDVALRTYVIYVYRPGAPPGLELPSAPPVGTAPASGGSTSPPAVIIPGAPSPPKTPTGTRKPRPPRTSAPVFPPGGSPSPPSQGAQTPPSANSPPGATSGPSNPVPNPVSTPGGSPSPGASAPNTPSGGVPGATQSGPPASGGSPGGSGSNGGSTPAPSSGGGSPPGGSTGGPPGSGGSTSAPGPSVSGPPGSASGGGTSGPPGTGAGGTNAPTSTGGGTPDSGSGTGGSPGTGGQGTGSGSPTQTPGSGSGTGSSNGGTNSPGGSGSSPGGGTTPSPSSPSSGGSQAPPGLKDPPETGMAVEVMGVLEVGGLQAPGRLAAVGGATVGVGEVLRPREVTGGQAGLEAPRPKKDHRRRREVPTAQDKVSFEQRDE